MKDKYFYIKKISDRGDHYGNDGGIMSLLEWCCKNSIQEVSVDEACYFYLNPKSRYDDFKNS